MRRGDVFPSKYLKAEDIKGRGDIRVTINYVEMEKMQDGTEKAVAYFKGKDKGLPLNSGNWDILEDAFGDSDDWREQKVILYTERTRKPDGTPTDGIRVKLPPQSTAAAKPAPVARAASSEIDPAAADDMNDEIPW